MNGWCPSRLEKTFVLQRAPVNQPSPLLIIAIWGDTRTYAMQFPVTVAVVCLGGGGELQPRSWTGVPTPVVLLYYGLRVHSSVWFQPKWFR